MIVWVMGDGVDLRFYGVDVSCYGMDVRCYGVDVSGKGVGKGDGVNRGEFKKIVMGLH